MIGRLGYNRSIQVGGSALEISFLCSQRLAVVQTTRIYFRVRVRKVASTGDAQRHHERVMANDSLGNITSKSEVGTYT